MTHEIAMPDPFAVATCKGTTVVGHVASYYLDGYLRFVIPGVSITCSVAGSRGYIGTC